MREIKEVEDLKYQHPSLRFCQSFQRNSMEPFPGVVNDPGDSVSLPPYHESKIPHIRTQVSPLWPLQIVDVKAGNLPSTESMDVILKETKEKCSIL